MTTKIKYAEAIKKLPKYIFAEIEELKQEKKKMGVDLISLGIGDPDIPTPDLNLDKIAEELRKPENQQYPPRMGSKICREGVARWYKNRLGVDLVPETE